MNMYLTFILIFYFYRSVLLHWIFDISILILRNNYKDIRINNMRLLYIYDILFQSLLFHSKCYSMEIYP